jgi:thioredoxin-dependent peroxiredoxin
MRLSAPTRKINFKTQDIHGNPVNLDDHLGKRVMLSFFRDAACPFCNFRVYELTHRYKTWQERNLVIIAVFSDTPEKVVAHVAKYPRPFLMLADPDLAIYNQYGVEHSSFALLKALLFRLPTIVCGILTGGRPSKNPHVRLVPADFLIDEDGVIRQIWYGKDTSDHIPLDQIDQFIADGSQARLKQKLSSARW